MGQPIEQPILTEVDKKFIASAIAVGGEFGIQLTAIDVNLKNLAVDMQEVKGDLKEVKEAKRVDPKEFEQAQKDIRDLRRQTFLWQGGLAVLSAVDLPLLLYLLYIHVVK